MIKGSATIELTNINTGEKKTIKENNFITNLISDVMQEVPQLGSCRNYFNNNEWTATQVINELFKGLLLFDKSMGEDPSSYHFKSGVNMVGRGIPGSYTGSDTMIGNFNTTESEVPNKLIAGKSFKYVWDFSTTQANGTISSICLCPQRTSYIGAGKPDSTSIYTPSLDYLAASNNSNNWNYTHKYRTRGKEISMDCNTHYYDFKNNKLYQIIESDVYNKKCIKVNVYDLSCNKIDILKGYGINGELDLLDSFTLDLPEELEDIVNSGANTTRGWQINRVGDTFFITFLPKYMIISPTDKIPVWEMSFSTKESTGKLYDNPFEGTNMQIGYRYSNDEARQYVLHSKDYMFVIGFEPTDTNFSNYNGQVVKSGTDTIKMYCINKIDNTYKRVTFMDGTDVSYNLSSTEYLDYFPFCEGNNSSIITDENIIYYSPYRMDFHIGKLSKYNKYSNNTYCLLDGESAMLKFIDWDSGLNNNNSSYIYNTPNNTFGKAYFTNASYYSNKSESYSDVYFYPFVVSTINNLESPIEKTDEQMMKITYELTITE